MGKDQSWETLLLIILFTSESMVNFYATPRGTNVLNFMVESESTIRIRDQPTLPPYPCFIGAMSCSLTVFMSCDYLI